MSVVNDSTLTEEVKVLDPQLFNEVPWQADLDDPLANAGTWTREEVEKRHLERLQKLRELYGGELDHLERKLHKVHGKRKDSRSLPNHDSTDLRRNSTPLTRALDRYHSVATRATTSSQQRLRTDASPCQSTSDSCSKPTLPGSLYCFAHILEDPNQVLYHRCAASVVRGQHTCVVPARTRGSLLPPLCHLHLLKEAANFPTVARETK